MVVGVCGFISTGSSAVVDYLKEFECLSTVDNMEFVLPYFPDGLEDLDFHINTACSKYASSVLGIERFRRHVYNFFVSKTKTPDNRRKVEEATERFINKIVQVTWQGYGAADIQVNCGKHYKSSLNMFKRKVFNWCVAKFEKLSSNDIDYFLRHPMEFSIQPEKFDIAAKALVKDILAIYGADFTKPLVLNQPFCGNNPEKSFKYFDDPVAIVVDRDPRDNYMFAKKFLRSKGRQIPTDTVEQYVEYYKRMRDGQPYKKPDKRILHIRFEDMIYRYDETTRKICEFCNVRHEDRTRKFFVPEMSINNTQVYKRYPEYENDILYIEKMLPDYLYPFDKFGDKKTDGQMFSGRSPLNK